MSSDDKGEDSSHNASDSQSDQQKLSILASNLGLELTPEIQALGSKEDITQALVQAAVEQGKTQEQIEAAI
jgi:hypothetical protein